MPPLWAAALAAAAALPVVCAGQHGFTIHEDLLAFPQFQVVFTDSYILEGDASSKLHSASSLSSARASSQTAPSDNAPSVYKPVGHKGRLGDASSDGSPEIPHSYEYVVFDSLPHLCSIPLVSESEQNDTSSKSSSEEEEEEVKELARARKRGSELIGHMDEPCLYYVSGWWSYSFCENSEVKQFHRLPPGANGAMPFPPVEDPEVPSYFLGRYDGSRSISSGRKPAHSDSSVEADTDIDGNPAEKATDLVEVKTEGNLRYLVQRLGGGTVCDLTGNRRRVEVQYHCAPGPGDMISSIKEVSTCSYRMVVNTPRLCNDVAFQPPKETPSHEIICREIVAEDGVTEWRARREARSRGAAAEYSKTGHKAKQVGQGGAREPHAGNDDDAQTTPEARKPRGPIIGGAELGGKETVGVPGKYIEPPHEFLSPPGGQQAKAAKSVETVARYDPKEGGKTFRMSDEQLKALSFSPEHIEKLNAMIAEMREEYPNRRWKIIMTEGKPGIWVLDGVFEKDIDIGSIHESEDEGQSQDDETGDGGNDEDVQGSEEEYYKDEL